MKTKISNVNKLFSKINAPFLHFYPFFSKNLNLMKVTKRFLPSHITHRSEESIPKSSKPPHRNRAISKSYRPFYGRPRKTKFEFKCDAPGGDLRPCVFFISGGGKKSKLPSPSFLASDVIAGWSLNLLNILLLHIYCSLVWFQNQNSYQIQNQYAHCHSFS